MNLSTVSMKIAGGVLALGLVAGIALAQDKPGTGGMVKPTGGGMKHVDKPHGNKDKGDKDQGDKDHGKKDEKAAAKIGEPAPALALKDTDGKDHTLAEHTKAGEIVVIEWFNADCPYIKKHHEINKTFNDLHTKYSGKKVTFLAVNSSAAGKEGSGLERNKKAKADYALAYPILLDESGEVGRAYGARTTPHVFIVGADGKLAYAGAIDDDNDPKTPGKVNYVAKALDEMLAGKPVSTTTTRPYGCGVKYGSDGSKPAPKHEKQN